ncbi:hypothetical protein N7451_011707 [Penicillium sp. IBT 35674x]|nr:hypothetical protein N7451_011707 [Penicillium sp. IBT 35674x]
MQCWHRRPSGPPPLTEAEQSLLSQADLISRAETLRAFHIQQVSAANAAGVKAARLGHGRPHIGSTRDRSSPAGPRKEVVLDA